MPRCAAVLAALFFTALLFAGCNINEEDIPEDTVSPHGGPLIMVHYMPWFNGPSVKAQETDQSKYQGHWSDWGRYNPATFKPDGRANIVGHYYPLTGPYDSSNPALLEYQVSLMKIAGIDGVIFDWYGSYVSNDFGQIHEHTKAMVSVLKKAGLKFLVCYEDNTLNMMGKSGNEALSIGKASFDWAQENWFRTSEYVRFESRPVVLCFGPQHFDTKAKWDTVFSGADPRPYFVDLDNRYPWADASFNWFNLSGGQTLTQALNNFYNGVQKNKPYRVATVYSAFDDDYSWGSYGSLDYSGGANFDLTWTRAVVFNPAIIQIATWNDYGEGTIIEPTIERGYNELEYIQDRIREWDSGFPFTKEDLRWPLEFYKLLYTQTAGAAQETAIKAAVNAVFAGDASAFRARTAETGLSVSTGDLKPLLRN